MLDLDLIIQEISCPLCGFYSMVTLKQIRLGAVIICGGCKVNIRLVDYMGTVWKARGDIKNALDELAKVLSKPIKIRL